MYAMMAPVEAGNVHFETPDLALPMIRELTGFEIDWVSGGALKEDLLFISRVSFRASGALSIFGGAAALTPVPGARGVAIGSVLGAGALFGVGLAAEGLASFL